MKKKYHPVYRKNHLFSYGFTLIEMGVILCILGVILFVGIASWQTLVEARRLARTKAVLEEAKDCILKRIYYTESYPRFHTGLDFTNSSADVDTCIASLRDAWGHPVRYLEGTDNSSTELQGQYIIKDEEEGRNNQTSPGPYSNATTRDGNVGDIAFVLISFGKDGKADDNSYGSLLDNDIYNPSNTAATFSSPLDFSNITDDVYLIVTGNELKSLLSE